jgi:N-acyl homoserine lactone hydrolase
LTAEVAPLEYPKAEELMPNAFANRLIALPGAMLSMRECDLMVGGSEKMIEIPVPSFLIEHPKSLVLFDTGCNPRVAVDPVAYWGRVASLLNVRFSPDLVVDAQVRAHGYKPEDVKYVVVSHLHLDHAGGLALFPHAKFFVMKGELPYAYWPDRHARGAFILDDLLPTRRFDWIELTEDTDLFGDGSMQMLKTAGHTPGESSLFIRLKKDGPIILTGDTLHLRGQLATLTGSPVDSDQKQASESVQRLKRIQDLGEARLWVSHDPDDWRNYPHVME